MGMGVKGSGMGLLRGIDVNSDAWVIDEHIMIVDNVTDAVRGFCFLHNFPRLDFPSLPSPRDRGAATTSQGTFCDFGSHPHSGMCRGLFATSLTNRQKSSITHTSTVDQSRVLRKKKEDIRKLHNSTSHQPRATPTISTKQS